MSPSRAATVSAFSLALIVAGAQLPGPAFAATPSASVKQEARERFDRGLSLFEKGESAAALAEFKRAFELIPNPVVLYNMGLVYAAMNRPVEATDALDRFLSAGGDTGAAAQRLHATKVRDEQAARVARLTVTVDRPATIEIDGIEVGQTPLAEPLRVASGTHIITALAPGYQPERREITLAGKVTETITLVLVPTETGSAHLTIVVAVPGAEVWINDKLVGSTPLPASVAVSPGPARVEIRRRGYLTTSRTLKLDEGANARLELPLDEDPAAQAQRRRLRVALSDPGASEITVDGAVKSSSADGIPLVAGPHVVRVHRVGFEPHETSIEMRPDRDTSLAVTLNPTLETRSRADDSARSRRVVGWWLFGGSVAVAGAAAVFAYLTWDDTSQAQVALNGQLAKEGNRDEDCYHGPNPPDPSYYEIHRCGELKASLQDDVTFAKGKRIAALSVVGLGAVLAGVGGYLILTGTRERFIDPAAPRVSLWVDGQSAGATLGGRF